MFRPQGNGGKGDAPRPTDWDKFSENFDNIFKKKQDDKPKEPPEEPSPGN
jgi:hypothetical protein